MTFGSLFAGIGGIDLGFERAGWKCKWQVEIDSYALRILEKHWPDVARYRDVRAFLGSKRWRRVRSAWAVDCIAGGFPCQDISYAGKGAGIQDGTRSGLWSEFARIVRLLRPRYVFVENVPALLNRGLGRVLGDLAALGYDAEWDCIPACAVGAPHLRWRVFVVAYTNDGNGKENGIPGGSHRDAPDAGRELPQGGDAGNGHGRRTATVRRPLPADATRNGRHQGRSGDSPEGEERRHADRGVVGCPLPDPASRWAGQRWRDEFAAYCQGQRDLYWSPAQPGVRGVHDGIPPTLDGVVNRVDRLKGLGNAVVPQVVEWIARRILSTHNVG